MSSSRLLIALVTAITFIAVRAQAQWLSNPPNQTCASPCLVGIDMTAPQQALDVTGRIRATSSAGFGEIFTGISGNLNAFHIVSVNNSLPLAFATNSAAPQMVLSASGNLGIGTTTPNNLLSLSRSSPPVLEIRNSNSSGIAAGTVLGTVAFTGTSSAYSDSVTSANPGAVIQAMGGGSWGNYLPASLVFGTTSTVSANYAERMRIDPAGNVGIGTSTPSATLDVNGTIHASGAITGATVIGAVYQDVAEWVPATAPMPAGTVVVLNRGRRNEVMPSSHAYDTSVAGVVSANPGVLLGMSDEGKAKIATTGRVKVHVDARRGAVAPGDLLVTSDVPGTAMKSEPVDLGGVRIHRPGTLLGKALEPLAGGEGDILVLLSLQ